MSVRCRAVGRCFGILRTPRPVSGPRVKAAGLSRWKNYEKGRTEKPEGPEPRELLADAAARTGPCYEECYASRPKRRNSPKTRQRGSALFTAIAMAACRVSHLICSRASVPRERKHWPPPTFSDEDYLKSPSSECSEVLRIGINIGIGWRSDERTSAHSWI
jgi:hypothetical protein